MKVTIISRAYLATENQKNIIELNKLVDVHCLVPDLTAKHPVGDLKFSLLEDGNRILPVKVLKVFRSQVIVSFSALRTYCSGRDIIHIEENPWSLLFIQVLLFKMIFFPRAKIICTVKKNTFVVKNNIKDVVRKQLAKFTIRHVSYIIASSKMVSTMLDEHFSFPMESVDTCHHLGVDTELFNAPTHKMRGARDPKEVIVGYCGRFDEDKGISDLLSAVKMARKSSQIKVTLKLLGAPLRDKRSDMVYNYAKRCPWVHIIPPVIHSEVASFLDGVDIFVLPSRVYEDLQEHDAHALLEAMASKLACIGTNSGIIPDLLLDGSGYLVESENPDQLAKALLKLIESKVEREKLGLLAREKAINEFSIEAVAIRKVAIYEKVLKA